MLWRRPRQLFVAVFQADENAVDHNGLLQARKRIHPQIPEDLVVSPRILVMKYHDNESMDLESHCTVSMEEDRVRNTEGRGGGQKCRNTCKIGRILPSTSRGALHRSSNASQRRSNNAQSVLKQRRHFVQAPMARCGFFTPSTTRECTVLVRIMLDAFASVRRPFRAGEHTSDFGEWRVTQPPMTRAKQLVLIRRNSALMRFSPSVACVLFC